MPPGQYKTTINAHRVRGDIDLGLEPSRIDGAGDPSWARMDFPGKILPGYSSQSIYEASDTAKYGIGTRRIEYGRTFRYAMAGRAIDAYGVEGRLLANANYVPDAGSHADEDGFYGKPYTQVEVGDTYVDLNTAVTFAANFFQGGYITSFVSPYKTQYIVKSDLGDGTWCRIYLDSAATVQVAVTVDVEVYPSPYSNVIDLSPSTNYLNYVSFIGLMQCEALAANDYFWLQTEGPCWIAADNWDVDPPGYAANQRDVYAYQNGTVKSAAGCNPTDGWQRVGYLLAATESGAGSVHTMLQLE